VVDTPDDFHDNFTAVKISTLLTMLGNLTARMPSSPSWYSVVPVKYKPGDGLEIGIVLPSLFTKYYDGKELQTTPPLFLPQPLQLIISQSR